MPIPESRIRVAIVDDHRMLLDALVEWLRLDESEIDVCLAVPTWSEMFMHPRFPVDVAVVDVDLKDGIPIDLKVAELFSCGVKTVMMSAYSDARTVTNALAAGALGYVLKSQETEAIAGAIRTVAEGRTWISAELQLHLNDPSVVELARLTPKERDVVGLYAGGATVKALASQLGLTDGSAKTHLKRARRKYSRAGIDIGSKIALRRRAIADGIIREGHPDEANALNQGENRMDFFPN